MNSFQFPTIRNLSKPSKPSSSPSSSIPSTKYKSGSAPSSPYLTQLSSGYNPVLDSSKTSKLHVHIDPNHNSKDPSSPPISSPVTKSAISPYPSPVSKPSRTPMNPIPTPMQSNPMNNGPFSPNNIFTTRRIWVKRVGGTPTTLLVHQNDIIDDVKLAVIGKFPTTLARLYDPADLMIKMDLQARQPVNLQHSNNNPGPAVKQQSIPTKGLQPPAQAKPDGSSIQQPIPQGKKLSISGHSSATNRLLLMSPDNASKVPASPIGSTQPNITNLPPSVNPYSLINLEPDQNVWQLLDLYYSHGMILQEALIIDTPEFPEYIHDQNQAQGNAIPRNYSSQRLQPQYQPFPYQQQNYLPPQPPIIENSATPNSYNGQYYQPKPQYSYQNNPGFGQQNSPNYTSSLPKDRSISPSNLNRVKSPNRAQQLHRRSFSNPSQSPVSSASYNNLLKSNNTGNNNGQAVLLLPKNFSLANSNSKQSSNNSDNVNSVFQSQDDNNNNASKAKRHSLDEGLVHGKQLEGQEQASKSASGSNLTNIGIGINSPTDPSGYPLPLKNPSTVLCVNDMANDSNSTLTSKNIGSLSITPSPPPNVSEQLNSPTRDDTSNLHNNRSLDSILPSAKASRDDKSNSNNGTNSNDKETKNTQKALETTRKKSETKGISAAVKSKTTTDKVLPSISVLVVEDNAINQAILGAFLRKHKIHYQIAKNGQEAVDKWRKGGFHLVLMDIQLPVKSGIEATKEIRYLEKINRIGVFAQNELASNKFKSPSELKEDQKLDLNIFRSPVIIVALTASSNSSVDRKNALTAGCNDYLTKPVNLVWLQNKITEWGCMQALIDFDGWRIKGINTNNSSSTGSLRTFNNTKTKDQANADVFKNSQKTLITN